MSCSGVLVLEEPFLLFPGLVSVLRTLPVYLAVLGYIAIKMVKYRKSTIVDFGQLRHERIVLNHCIQNFKKQKLQVTQLDRRFDTNPFF